MHFKNGNLTRLTSSTKWSLKETLRPWWKLTEYGLLFDWCHTCDSKRTFVTSLRKLGVILNALLLFAVAGFQFFRLIVSILTTPTLHSIIPFLVWFASMPLAIYIQLHFVSNRTKFLSFFDDWAHYEQYLAPQNSRAYFIPMLKKDRLHTIIQKYFLIFAIPTSMLIIVQKDPAAPYLLSYYQFFRDTLTLPGIGAIHFYNIMVILVLMILSDAVPGMIFYHVGMEIRILLKETEKLFTVMSNPSLNTKITNGLFDSGNRMFSIKIRKTVDCFDSLRKMVKRANILFGSAIAQNHGIKFFIILHMLYSIINEFQMGCSLNASLYCGVLTYNVYDLIRCTMLTANVYCSSEQLRIDLTSMVHQNWDLISIEDRDLLRGFLGFLHTDPLAATPLGLYKVTPSILLTLTSLTVTYLVILFQAK